MSDIVYPVGDGDVFRSPSGRLVLTMLPWYDHQHTDICAEIDSLIEALQALKKGAAGV